MDACDTRRDPLDSMLAVAAAQRTIAETLRALAPAERLHVISSTTRALLDEPVDLPADFPTRLQVFRMARGYAQADLARIAGVSSKVISMYESGQGRPSRQTLDRITAALGVDGARLAIDREKCVSVSTSPYARAEPGTLDHHTHPADRKLVSLKPAPPREPRREWNPKTPRTIAIDQTVALAIVRGEITNREVVGSTGLGHKGADKRIQFSAKANRIERVRNGVYVAAEAEYVRLGLDPKKRGNADREQTVTKLAERFAGLREIERMKKEQGR